MATAIVARNGRAKRSTPKNRLATLITTSTPQVVPYGRFSDPSQRTGDSERRQEDDRARRYAERVSLPFNETLRMFDRGLSAFHGEHIARGDLGRFLACIDSGMIATGSILWVESIDRLTRGNPMAAMKMVLYGIIDKGVGIYVDDLATLYDAKQADDQIGELYGEIKRAYREPKRKSELLKASWEQKRKRARENGKTLSTQVPMWIAVGKDGSRKAKPKSSQALTLMFQWRESGLGYSLITQKLNATKRIWSPSDGWGVGYVKKVLRWRAVIGEFQPCRYENGKQVPDGDPIPDYYPVMVDSGLFHRAQRIKGETKGGRNDKESNVLQHLCRCAYCQGPMHWKTNGRYEYLICANGRDGKSECHDREPGPAIPYAECENVILEKCQAIRPEAVLPSESAQTRLCQSLRKQIARTEATVADFQQRIAHANELAETGATPERRTHWDKRAQTLETDKSDATKHVADLRLKLQKTEHRRESFKQWQTDLASLNKALASGDVEIRQRLNAHLHQFIDHIEVFTDGLPPDYDGEDFADYFEAVVASIEQKRQSNFRYVNRNFVAWVCDRQRTQHGRFLRLHWKLTAEQIERRMGKHAVDGLEYVPWTDFPPAGSITGEPDVDTLWEQFRRQRTRSTR